MLKQEKEENIMHGQQSHEEKDMYRDTPLRYLGNRSFTLLRIIFISYFFNQYCHPHPNWKLMQKIFTCFVEITPGLYVGPFQTSMIERFHKKIVVGCSRYFLKSSFLIGLWIIPSS